MLRYRQKREAELSARALQRLDAIEASISKLGDEDLLDLADIFKADAVTPLALLASAEMSRRNISL